MATTSTWTWNTISITQDTYSDDDGVLFARNSWRVIRSRYTDQDITPQLGEYSSTLTATNGTREKTLETPSNKVFGLQFDTTRNWVYDTAFFVETDLPTVNGKTVYKIYSGSDKPTAGANYIVFLLGNFSRYEWAAVRSVGDPDPSDTALTDYIDYSATQEDFALNTTETAANQQYDDQAGTFVGDSDTGILGLLPEAGGQYYCESDVQSFDEGVEWAKQTQTWTFKDEYKS